MKKQGKKILIGVLIAILIGGLIFVFILKSCNQSNSINQANIPSITSEKEKTDNENIVLDNEVSEDNIESVNQSNLNEKNNNKEEQIVVNTKTTTTNNASNSDEKTIVKKENNIQKNNIESSQNNEKNNTTPKVEEVPEEKSEPNISHAQNKETENEVEINNKEDSGDEQKNNQSITEDKTETKEEPKEEIKQEEVYSYKYNATMTEQIRQDIINNESEYMKKNGYTIKIDESIVDLTNQFTYTAERVKSKIVKKFGTIRIYARDFYYNGSYIFTECYII